MRITLVQTALTWEAPKTNREMLTEKVLPLAGQTDLIVLPEMCTTGFSMNAAALAEPMDGLTTAWFAQLAAQTGSAVVGTFICQDGDAYFNRLVWQYPDGRRLTYDKKHLFTLAGEHKTYQAGIGRLMVEWLGWRICPLICYDLRFPVWSRNRQAEPYDLLLYVANWPSRRAAHWQQLLAARAIENQAYVAGVNIVGQDGNGLEYQGDSALIDYAGAKICQLSFGEGIFTGKLSMDKLQNYRQQLPFLADSDLFRWI
jgi:omega-amidase